MSLVTIAVTLQVSEFANAFSVLKLAAEMSLSKNL